MIEPGNKRKIISVREKYSWAGEALDDLEQLASKEDYWRNVKNFLLPLLDVEWNELTLRQEKLVQRARRELDERIREDIEKSETGDRAHSD